MDRRNTTFHTPAFCAAFDSALPLQDAAAARGLREMAFLTVVPCVLGGVESTLQNSGKGILFSNVINGAE